MKKLFSYTLVLLLLAAAFMTDSPPPGWYQQTLPVSDQINDIFFLDSLTGWVVTNSNLNPPDSGYIIKTTSGGNSWVIQNAGITRFNVIQFLDYNTGYAGAETPTAKVYKSTNGGNSWSVISSMLTGLTDMFIVNRDTGWYCEPSSFGGIFKTTNGGVSWFPQAPQTYMPQKLFFINRDTGWAISSDNKLYRTPNSGINWNLLVNFQSEDLVDLFFVNFNTGWLHGGPTGIYKTTNAGLNWITQETPLGYGSGKLFFTDSMHGWVGRSNSQILITINGNDWGYQNTPFGSHYSVQFFDTSKGWAGGTGIVRTDDGGGSIIYNGIKPSSTFVTAFELKQNYPNPFNPSTTIEFYVQKPSRISLKIYTIDGREAAELLDYERFDAGYTYYAEFNAGNLSSGVYLYQMTGWTLDKKEIFIDTKKMILLK